MGPPIAPGCGLEASWDLVSLRPGGTGDDDQMTMYDDYVGPSRAPESPVSEIGSGDTAPGLALIDRRGMIQAVNGALGELLGWSDDLFVGRALDEVLGTLPARQLLAGTRHAGDEQTVTFEFPNCHRAHRVLSARSWTVEPYPGFTYVVVAFTPQAKRRDETIGRGVTDKLIDTFMESVTDAVLVMDEDGQVVSASQSVEEVFGWPRRTVVGSGIKMLLNPVGPSSDRDLMERLAESDSIGGIGVPIHTSGLRRDGSIIPLELRVVKDTSTHPPTYVGFIRDLRAIERLAARLDLASRTDQLTGLLSQRSFMDEMRALVEHADRPWSVVKMDLARFRYVNQAHGFAIGDQLLRSVARHLRALIPEGPVGRVGGDRFAFVTGTDEVDAVVWEVRSRIEGGGRSRGISHPLRINVGVAHCTGRETAEELMRSSDAATRAAKNSSEGLYQTFDDELRSSVDAETKLVGDLHGALTAHELVTFFQPEVKLADQSIVGHEALVRWRHPVRGLLGPDEFLSLATAEGLMPGLGVSVFAASLEFIRTAEQHGHGGRVWVNLSAGQLFDDSVLRYAKAAIEFGVDPERLGFELTEQVALAVATVASDNLNRLVDLGVALAIDDFGTGYSTLSQLRMVPADVVKLDRSFLVDIHTDRHQRDFVGACINLAHTLEMSVIVEGIETQADATLMAEMGCEAGQGFWFGRPVPAEEALGALHP